jgi:hypothetical protein
MTTKLVKFTLDDQSEVFAEVYEDEGTWVDAADDEGDEPTALLAACERFQKAVGTIMSGLKAISPQDLEVKFGIKMSGKVGWVFAGASTEGNLQVTLKWKEINP